MAKRITTYKLKTNKEVWDKIVCVKKKDGFVKEISLNELYFDLNTRNISYDDDNIFGSFNVKVDGEISVIHLKEEKSPVSDLIHVALFLISKKVDCSSVSLEDGLKIKVSKTPTNFVLLEFKS